MAFTLEAFQNRHLALGETRVHAVVTLTAASPSSGPPSPPPAKGAQRMVGFVLDKSGSMVGERLVAVTRATIDAIEMLPADAWFFVVAFDAGAHLVVGEGPATPQRKMEAAQKLLGMRAFGGTAMSVGLMAARSLFVRKPNALRQAIFLTDGKNESESGDLLARALGACAAVFTCDCWGVGTDWRVGEVQSIAQGLSGRTWLVTDPDAVRGAFRGAVAKASAKTMRDVKLRLWVPEGARVAFVKQVSPTLLDLTDKAQPAGQQVRDYPTGAWAPRESRDFHVAIDVPAGEEGEEVLAARPAVVYEELDATAEGGWTAREDRPPEGRVFAAWTADRALAGHVDERVSHYTAQSELADAVQRGLAARARGDDTRATQMLGRALELARSSQHLAVTQRLGAVVKVDARTGSLELDASASREAEMALELEAHTTTPPSSSSPRPDGDAT